MINNHQIPLTVVVPTHGRVDLFRATLKSLEAQTASFFELIITDDSQDLKERQEIEAETHAFMECSGHPSRYIFSQPNLGQAQNTNQGLLVAKGQFIRILHSDDLLAPNTIEAEIKLMEDPCLNIEVLYHQVEPFRSLPQFDKIPNFSLVQPALLFKSTMHSSTPLPSAIIFKREVLDRVGGMRGDLDFLCDWEFCTRIVADQSKLQKFIGTLSSGFVGWRIHSDSTTGKLWHKHFFEHEQFMSELQNNFELTEELIGDERACDDFFSKAVRYRHNRLFCDISLMPPRQILVSLPKIFKCMFSSNSIKERFKRAQWLKLSSIKYRHLNIVPYGSSSQVTFAPTPSPKGVKFVLSSYLAKKILDSAKNHFKIEALLSVSQKIKLDVNRNTSPVNIGQHIEFRPNIDKSPEDKSGLFIFTEFNNKTNLWQIKELVKKSPQVTVTGLNHNIFMEPVLHHFLKFTNTGTQVKFNIHDNCHLTYFGLKALLEKNFPNQFRWVEQTSLNSTNHQIILQRDRVVHSCYLEPHTGWTFGMLTSGKRLENVKKFISSIEEYCDEPHEIIIISPVNIDELDNKPNIRVINFSINDKLGWITRKKNIICDKASFSDILICHDRFWLSQGFTHTFKNWGYAYGLATPKISLENSQRALDWAVVSSENCTWSSGGLLDYRVYSKYSYNPGGATIIRKSFWKDYPWNENLFWNEHEDVELCRRIQRAGGIISFVPAKLITAVDRWVNENPEIPYCDQNEVLFGQPVGEQRIRFIPKPNSYSSRFTFKKIWPGF